MGITHAEKKQVGGPQIANACMMEVYLEIEKLAELHEDWNDEGAPAIDRTCIFRVQRFAQQLDCALTGKHISDDIVPSVFPDIDGGIELYWKTSDRQRSITFHPNQAAIDVREKEICLPSKRLPMSYEDALAYALSTMHATL